MKPQRNFERNTELKIIRNRLKSEKRLMIVGPDGRGRSSLLTSLAAGYAGPRVFHFRFAKNEGPIPRFISEFAGFLAARGDFLLSNIMVDEEPNSKHETALVRVLRGARPEHRGVPLLMCLEDLNSVARGEEFFRSVIEWFPCISCQKAVECTFDADRRHGCEEETASGVLVTSTKRPSDRWFRSEPFPLKERVYEIPPLSDDEIARLAKQIFREERLAHGVAGIWRAYGSEAFAIPICEKYSAKGWDPEQVLRLIEEDIVSWLVAHFQNQLGSDKSLNIMRLIGLLNGCISETEIRHLFRVAPQEGEDELTTLLSRGLVRVEEGRLFVTSLAWTEGHRRSRWLDRLPEERSFANDLAAYVRSSVEAAEYARKRWTEVQSYLPRKGVEDVRALPVKSTSR
jgi:hypothetical protein